MTDDKNQEIDEEKLELFAKMVLVAHKLFLTKEDLLRQPIHHIITTIIAITGHFDYKRMVWTLEYTSTRRQEIEVEVE